MILSTLAQNKAQAAALCEEGNVLIVQARSLQGEAQKAKLAEVQEKLEAALRIEPNNAFVMGRLGDVLRGQAALNGK